MSGSQDPFEDLLHLEEQYYKEGYDEGFKDGAEAGRIEGYSLGLTKGLEKFLEAGRLQSKAVVWANRIPKYQRRRLQQDVTSKPQEQTGTGRPAVGDVESQEGEKEGDNRAASKNEGRLPPIHSNSRLEKNIEMLYGLVEPGTLSMNNEDEAVNDFDSRIKGAHGRVKMIERAVGPRTAGQNATALLPPAGRRENIEDAGMILPRVETETTDA
ncbi:DUF1715-domain-containing protein [Xylaria sp. CBS 124048]|nr:DUF1715-domain-containing protein [Xylaria sp. CBS 124048]